jgi:hypothetical protein
MQNSGLLNACSTKRVMVGKVCGGLEEGPSRTRGLREAQGFGGVRVRDSMCCGLRRRHTRHSSRFRYLHAELCITMHACRLQE